MSSVLFGAAVSLLVLAGGDTAATPPEEHCVVVVVDQKQDGEIVTSDAVCFKAEADAERWAADILVPATDSDLAATSEAPAASFTLGRHYDGANGTGSSIRIVGSSCTGGYWNTGTAWANRISSSYNGCARLRHWDGPDRTGSAEDTYGAGTTDNLSFMSNRTESVSYHSS